MQPGASYRGRLSPSLYQPIHCHAVVGQKTRKSDNPAAATPGKPAKARALALHHSPKQQAPLFESRSSPNVPSVITPACMSNPHGKIRS